MRFSKNTVLLFSFLVIAVAVLAGVLFYLMATDERHVELLPGYRLRGKVVPGFKRGSKMLGFPTANMDPAAFKHVLKDVRRGVYCGWAKVNSGKVYKAFISLGQNPHFKATEETVEAYLAHNFPQDFYGSELTLVICGFIRPQVAFTGIDDLITAIAWDVHHGSRALDTPKFASFAHDEIFGGAQVEPGDANLSDSPFPLDTLEKRHKAGSAASASSSSSSITSASDSSEHKNAAAGDQKVQDKATDSGAPDEKEPSGAPCAAAGLNVALDPVLTATQTVSVNGGSDSDSLSVGSSASSSDGGDVTPPRSPPVSRL